jgi:hypothetical protein
VIIHCLSFGSLWWIRPGSDAASSTKFTKQAALFNTTGFKSGSRERRNWIIGGIVRFNVGTCLDQRMRLDHIETGKFFSSGLEHRGSENRILLTRKVKASTPADMILLCIGNEVHGRIAFDSEWRSGGVRILSASEFRDRQETLILMPVAATITTKRGTWECKLQGTNLIFSSITTRNL